MGRRCFHLYRVRIHRHYRYLIVIALSGIGLGANIQKMVKTGPKPILLGLMVWALVALSSLTMQSILHQF